LELYTNFYRIYKLTAQMKHIKTSKSTKDTRIRRSQAPTSGPRRPGRLGLSQGRPLALTRCRGAARACPRRGLRANASTQRGVAAAGGGMRPGMRAGRGRRVHGELGAAWMLTHPHQRVEQCGERWHGEERRRRAEASVEEYLRGRKTTGEVLNRTRGLRWCGARGESEGGSLEVANHSGQRSGGRRRWRLWRRT
jgi:hypothetical protein